ncbi:MAG TPA: glycosyltransferase family 39 protein [Ktedonobacteraceae bacterium]
MSVSITKNDISTGKTKQVKHSPNWQTFLLWGAVVALVAVAVGMRLYHLGLPFDRDGYDEGVYWQTLRSMSAGNALYQHIFYSQPAFFILSTFPGYVLGGSSLWSARFAIALVSLFGLLGAFLLGKALSGRLGAIAALLLLVVNPLYLAQSQTIEAEVSSAAFSLLAVGLAYLWWKHPEGTRGLCYATLTGITLTLSILCKLLSVSMLVPIALLMLVRLWQIWRKQPGTRLIGLLPIIVGIGACILTFVVLLLPFSGSYQSILQSVITFHSDAAPVYNTATTQQDNFATIQGALTSLLTLTALYGIVAALLRRDWRVIPLFAWMLATFFLLWRQVPLFPHHLVALTPPLIALAVMGISDPSTQNKESSSGFMPRATTYLTWVAIALILVTAILDVRQDRVYYRTAQASSVSALTQFESRVAADLRHATTHDQLVVTDAQFIAGLADRTTPPDLVDTSAVRINSGYLTLSQLESATTQPQVHAVLFFTGRFHLPNVAAFHAWVAQNFHLLHNYGDGRELWVR